MSYATSERKNRALLGTSNALLMTGSKNSFNFMNVSSINKENSRTKIHL